MIWHDIHYTELVFLLMYAKVYIFYLYLIEPDVYHTESRCFFFSEWFFFFVKPFINNNTMQRNESQLCILSKVFYFFS